MATPGRLHDFVDRSRVSFDSIRFVVLDEADRMLDMGFIPSVEKMMEHPTMVPLVSISVKSSTEAFRDFFLSYNQLHPAVSPP